MKFESPKSAPASWPARLAGLLLLAGLMFLLAACHDGIHPRDTLSPVSDSGEVSAWYYQLYLWVDIVIFAIVVAIFVIALVRFRMPKDDDGSLPPQVHGSTKMELVWTIIPTIVVVVLAVITIGGVFKLATPPPADERSITVEVTGKQWWWDFDYVNEKITAANELHLEVGTPVTLNLTSADVIHAFWVPRMSGKRDCTPGRTQPLYFTPREVGSFDGQCAELCGASHALMGLRIVVHPKEGEDSYLNWVAHQARPARDPQTEEERKGRELFKTRGCVACHSIAGVAELQPTARNSTSGPDLTHVGSRQTLLALTRPNTVEDMAAWIHDPASVKQGSRMPKLGISTADAKTIATYLYSLK